MKSCDEATYGPVESAFEECMQSYADFRSSPGDFNPGIPQEFSSYDGQISPSDFQMPDGPDMGWSDSSWNSHSSPHSSGGSSPYGGGGQGGGNGGGWGAGDNTDVWNNGVGYGSEGTQKGPGGNQGQMGKGRK